MYIFARKQAGPSTKTFSFLVPRHCLISDVRSVSSDNSLDAMRTPLYARWRMEGRMTKEGPVSGAGLRKKFIIQDEKCPVEEV